MIVAIPCSQSKMHDYCVGEYWYVLLLLNAHNDDLFLFFKIYFRDQLCCTGMRCTVCHDSTDVVVSSNVIYLVLAPNTSRPTTSSPPRACEQTVFPAA
jgi:hypothetical protein